MAPDLIEDMQKKCDRMGKSFKSMKTIIKCGQISVSNMVKAKPLTNNQGYTQEEALQLLGEQRRKY